MEYETLAEQPYTQTTATPLPQTHQQQLAEYDNIEVGSYLHWFDGWARHAGTVQWAEDWKPMSYRVSGRERLLVVAWPEQVNKFGFDSHGGLSLLNIERWVEHIPAQAAYVVEADEKGQGFTIAATEARDEEYCHVSDIASTGIRYRRPVTEFIKNVVRRHEAERSFDQAIASQLDERNDW